MSVPLLCLLVVTALHFAMFIFHYLPLLSLRSLLLIYLLNFSACYAHRTHPTHPPNIFPFIPHFSACGPVSPHIPL